MNKREEAVAHIEAMTKLYVASAEPNSQSKLKLIRSLNITTELARKQLLVKE